MKVDDEPVVAFVVFVACVVVACVIADDTEANISSFCSDSEATWLMIALMSVLLLLIVSVA